MNLDRREFFLIAGAALGTLAVRAQPDPGQPELGDAGAAGDSAEDVTTALGIHRRTRNTRFGPFGRISLPGRAPKPFKTYPGLRRVGLPEDVPAATLAFGEAVRGYAPSVGGAEAAAGADPGSRGAETSRDSAEPLSLAELARLLLLTNGVTARTSRGGARRAAPSAGALYAGEVYVLAGRVGDLAPGVYYYAVLEHELVEVRGGPPLADAAAALEEPGAIERAAAVVVLTNVFERYARRYGDRGYRYALIDSGHQGENLRLAAFAAGLADVSPLGFDDDRLNELLGIDGREEAVCAVHALGWRGDPPRAGAQPARVFAEKRVALREALARKGRDPERYHEATKLVPAAWAGPAAGDARVADAPRALKDSTESPGSARKSAAGAPTAESRPPESTARALDAETAPTAQVAPSDQAFLAPAMLALPRVLSPPATVDDAIRVRRSTRRFEPEPLSLDDLGFVLEMAQGNPALERAPGVEMLVVVHRVEGVAAGLHHYDARAHTLETLRTGDLREALTRVCLGQRKAGEAGLAIAMVAGIARAAEARGERVYRDLLVEAGAIGERVYLAAEARGLTARNLAAFRDGELNALLGTDGRERAVIHLTLVGRGD